jgi:uncharacterized protein YjcR
MPRRKPVRNHPIPLRKKAFEMYLDRYTAPEIERKLSIPADTFYGWCSQYGWSQLRDEVTVDFSDVVTKRREKLYHLLEQTLRIASKLNSQVEALLDAGQLPPKELCDTATAFQRNCDTILRMAGR